MRRQTDDERTRLLPPSTSSLNEDDEYFYREEEEEEDATTTSFFSEEDTDAVETPSTASSFLDGKFSPFSSRRKKKEREEDEEEDANNNYYHKYQTSIKELYGKVRSKSNASTLRVMLTVAFISGALMTGAWYGRRFGGDLYVKVRPKRESAIGKSRRHAEVAVTLVDEAKYPYAKCLDGTMGSYYASFAPSSGIAKKAHYKNLAGSGDKFVKKSEAEIASSAMDGFSTHRTWVIMLNGGGECVEGQKCSERAETELGSSSLAAPTHEFKSGLTELHETHNPAFMYANMVVVNYCSGDSFLGRGTEADEDGLWHSGGHIVDAVIDTLLENHEMKNADKVLIAGRSSAGIGVLSQADRWRTMIERAAKNTDWWTNFRRSKPAPKVYAAPFAGFRYTHRSEESNSGNNKESSGAAEEKPLVNNKKQQRNTQRRTGTVRRALLSTSLKVHPVAPDFPEAAVANRDRNLKEELDRTKKKIDLLEIKKQLSQLERERVLEGAVAARESNGEVANRDKNIIEEVERTKNRIELLEMKKQQNHQSRSSEELQSADLGEVSLEELQSADLGKVPGPPTRKKPVDDEQQESKGKEEGSSFSLRAKITRKAALKKMEGGGNDGELERYIKYWHAKRSLNRACVTKNEESYWKCASAEEAFKHVKTPVFISQALTDALLSEMVGDNASPYGLSSDPSNPSVEGALGKREKIALKKLTSADILSMNAKEESNDILRLMSLNATAREIYAENMMKVMRSELKMVVEHPNAGVFAPACYAHNDFDEVYIDGIDHHTALAWWVFKDSNVKLVDTCSGVFCNPTCKHSLAESSIVPRANEDGTDTPNVKQGARADMP
jgi:hypothetical protein